MKTKTQHIKLDLNSIDTWEDRMAYLKNRYHNEECFILGCGPSLLEYPAKFLKSYLSNKLVLSIKQSLLICDDADFHFYNDNNIIPYHYQNHTINCFSASTSSSFGLFRVANPEIIHPDIFTPIEKPIASKALSSTLKFDDYLLEDTLTRPWGPGIISEIVFYMAVHLGVGSICTLGWDLTDSTRLAEGKHFYDDFVKKNDMINPAIISIEKDTQNKDIMLSGKICEWLKSKNIELVTASKNTHIHKNIKRITL